MNDSTSQIALIQSRLPYTDRRALSQAWFSALHLAAEGTCSAPARNRRARAGEIAAPSRRAGIDRDECGSQRPPVAGSPRLRRALEPAPMPESARRFAPPREHRTVRPHAPRPQSQSHAPFRAALALGLERERVQLLIRRDGATLHVLAVCRPHVAETVRRALALAERHLRAGGAAVRASVRAFDERAVRA